MEDKSTTQDPEVRKQIYEKFRDDLLKRQLSNNENLDRSLLTLSSAAIGLSITFINGKTFSDYMCILILAWIGFALSIAATILSYFMSQKAIAEQLRISEDYYLNFKDTAIKERNRYSDLHELTTKASAGLFVFGIIMLVVFLSVSLKQPGDPKMNDKKSSDPIEIIKKGASVPSMQPLPKATTANSNATDQSKAQTNSTSTGTKK